MLTIYIVHTYPLVLHLLGRASPLITKPQFLLLSLRTDMRIIAFIPSCTNA